MAFIFLYEFSWKADQGVKMNYFGIRQGGDRFIFGTFLNRDSFLSRAYFSNYFPHYFLVLS